MWTVLGFLKTLLKDELGGEISYGKATALPFLCLAWVIGLGRGVQLFRAHQNPDDLIWSLSGVALSLYITYRTGHVILARGQMAAGANVTTAQVVVNGPQAPGTPAPPPNSSAPVDTHEPTKPPTPDPS